MLSCPQALRWNRMLDSKHMTPLRLLHSVGPSSFVFGALRADAGVSPSSSTLSSSWDRMRLTDL
eukprot:7331742-Karenia_brevis.AAC.1